MKKRVLNFIAGLLLVLGAAALAHDVKAIVSLVQPNVNPSGPALTTIGDVWAVMHDRSLSSIQDAVASHATLPTAKSAFETVTRLPVAFVLMFASLVLVSLKWPRGVLRRRSEGVIPSGPQKSQDKVTAAVPMIVRPQGSAHREFLPAALELIETPTSPIVLASLWFVCIAFSSVLAWSYFGRLDIYAVANGKIQPSGRSKVVQPFEAGKVVAVHVENGSRVEAGDVLVELDPTETTADRDVQARELEASSAEVVRRRTAVSIARSAALETRQIDFDAGAGQLVRRREEGMLAADIGQLASALNSLEAQLSELAARRDRVTMTIDSRSKLIKVLKERVDTRQTLDASGQGYRSKVIDALQEFEREQTTLVGDQGQLIEFDANKRSIEAKIEETLAQFVREQTDKLSEAERKTDRLRQELIKANTKNERTRLTSPISGVVQQLAVTTLGQVVSGGQSLMTVVPQDAPVEIEAMVLNPDIGFVEVGQPVTIKVDAFPFTRYGTLEGTVVNISRDGVDQRTSPTLSDAASLTKPGSGAPSSPARGDTLAFPAKVSISRQSIHVDGKEVRLLPGMAVTVEVKTGRRRVIDYVLSPLREIQSASLTER